MVTKKDMAVAILATFCLTSTLFMVVPIKSQVGTTSSNEYDPWIDTNDDGIIDIFDIAALALAFGAEGTPINKTALLLDLQNRVSVLEEKQDYFKTIRFYTPNETMNDKVDYEDAAVFVWNPRNATNNAIMSGVVYFRYFSSADWTVRILVNEFTAVNSGVQENTGYEQTYMYALNTISNFMPNQNSYTIKFQISATPSVPTYVKDINILLEVMDGLPPENQAP